MEEESNHTDNGEGVLPNYYVFDFKHPKINVPDIKDLKQQPSDEASQEVHLEEQPRVKTAAQVTSDGEQVYSVGVNPVNFKQLKSNEHQKEWYSAIKEEYEMEPGCWWTGQITAGY